MASLSEKLRRERELRGISLKQISEDTKIGVRFLEALEEDRLDVIPGEFYRRSYLRAYARYLGLDEDRAVNAYVFSQSEQEDENQSSQPAEASPSWLPWVALGALVTVGGASFLAFRSDPGPGEVAPSSLPGATVLAEPNPSEPSEKPVPDEAAAVPVLSPNEPSFSPAGEAVEPTRVRRGAEGALHLVVSVGEPCWLEIEADGQVVTTGLKEEGYRREFAADEEIRLWLGNAGGVSLWVNGRPLKPLGRPGQVRKDLLITPENFMELVREDVS